MSFLLSQEFNSMLFGYPDIELMFKIKKRSTYNGSLDSCSYFTGSNKCK